MDGVYEEKVLPFQKERNFGKETEWERYNKKKLSFGAIEPDGVASFIGHFVNVPT